MRNRQKLPGFLESITDSDVATVRGLIDAEKDTEFLRDRRARNVVPPAPEFSRGAFRHVLMGCLMTTQQRSTKGSPVNRFLNTDSFPLTLASCGDQPSIERFVLSTIKEFGGIRRGKTIAKQANENWNRLNAGHWQQVEEWFERLRKQRAREPRSEDRALEREAARWADKNLAGLGRNKAATFGNGWASPVTRLPWIAA